jgi:hypothetical protein
MVSAVVVTPWSKSGLFVFMVAIKLEIRMMRIAVTLVLCVQMNESLYLSLS